MTFNEQQSQHPAQVVFWYCFKIVAVMAISLILAVPLSIIFIFMFGGRGTVVFVVPPLALLVLSCCFARLFFGRNLSKLRLPKSRFWRIFPLTIGPALVTYIVLLGNLWYYNRRIWWLVTRNWAIGTVILAIVCVICGVSLLINYRKLTFPKGSITAMVVMLFVVISAIGIANFAWNNRPPPPISDWYGDDTWRFWEEFRPFGENTRTVRADFEPDFIISENWPRLDGATAFLPIYSALVETLYFEADRFISDWCSSSLIQLSTTRGAFHNLIFNNTDIIFTLQPSQEQIEYAARRGVAFIMTPIAREAFAFFVNEDNPVTGLTVEQIQQIYMGEITNWHYVGGNDAAIAAYQRNPNSGSQTTMEQVVMDGLTMAEPPTELMHMGMGGMLRIVTQYANHDRALGYSFRFYATVMNPQEGLRLLAVDGIYPTPANIANGTYPFTVNVYAITTQRALDENPNTQLVIDWLLSAQGQQLIDLTGYVGLSEQ